MGNQKAEKDKQGIMILQAVCLHIYLWQYPGRVQAQPPHWGTSFPALPDVCNSVSYKAKILLGFLM